MGLGHLAMWLFFMEFLIEVKSSAAPCDTLLGNACMKNQWEIIEFYMNLEGTKQIDFNALHDSEGTDVGPTPITLFHEACKHGSVDVVKLFLKHADKLKIELNPGSRNLPNSGLFLIGTPLMSTISIEVLMLLLSDSRIDVNAKDFFGETALTKIFKGAFELEVIEVFLQCSRINLIGTDDAGNTAFHKACYNKDPEKAEKYLKKVIKI